MDFKLTEEQQMIRETAREFAQNELAPGVAERDRDENFPGEQLKKLGELGFMGITVPEEYGGAGLDPICSCLAIEEISKIDASMGVILSVTNSLACHPIERFGTEEQKRRYLVPLASGQMLGGFSMSEPGAGSDAAALTTTAVRDGDFYVINGGKNFVTSGKNGDVFILMAVTDKAKGAKGISAFILEQGTPGMTVGHKEKKLGIRGSDTTSFSFDDCRIPKENLLGEEEMGFKIALTALDSGRLGIACQALGIAGAALDESIKYSKERKQFGKFLSEFQAIQFKLADMETQINATRLLIYQAAMKKDRGDRYSKEAAMAKLYASEVAMRCSIEAVQIHGGYGYTKDYPVERFMRDAKITEIYEGTSEVQRMVIANSLLR
ncbi:acyl-CoA dehydrogenase [candidate division KSB1 bacterium]|nr:acyl-CoA dehydrogenase [candidate division KSB1 bacterium]